MAKPATSLQPEITTKKSFVSWSLATLFGVGFLQPGPGTWASAVTAIVWIAFQRFFPNHFWPATLVAALVVTLIGIPSCNVVERESGHPDPGFAVIDEVAGQLIALIAVPARWNYVLASFILFRVFDIFKPPPIRRLEKFPGGWGIVLDDVGAGLYALLLMQLWLHFVVTRT